MAASRKAGSQNNNFAAYLRKFLNPSDLLTLTGCAACTWLTVLFFDLAVFSFFSKNKEVHKTSVIITSIIVSVGLSYYRYIMNIKSEKIKLKDKKEGKNVDNEALDEEFGTTKIAGGLLIIPNALLIYLNALGFQVGTKEAALRLYANEMKDQSSVTAFAQTHIAGFHLFSWLANQTSWLPGKDLTEKVSILESKNIALEKENSTINQKYTAVNESLRKIQKIHDSSLLGCDAKTIYYSHLAVATLDSLRSYETVVESLRLENKNLLSRIYRILDSVKNSNASSMSQRSFSYEHELNTARDSLNNCIKKRNVLASQLNVLQARVIVHNDMLSLWRIKSKKYVPDTANNIINLIDAYLGKGYSKMIFAPIDTVAFKREF